MLTGDFFFTYTRNAPQKRNDRHKAPQKKNDHHKAAALNVFTTE